MSSIAPVSFSAAGTIGTIVFDDPGAKANLLDLRTLAAFEAAIATAEQDTTIKALIVTSAKERIFVAGADLKLLAAFTEEAAASEFSRRGQQLLERIAGFRVPVVCAIH